MPIYSKDLPNGYYLSSVPFEDNKCLVYLYDHPDFNGVRHIAFGAQDGGAIMPVTDLVNGAFFEPVAIVRDIDMIPPVFPTKTLHNSDISGARVNVKDIKVVGNGDTFQLICKVSSEAEGWMKSTKAMFTGNGCVVQVTTQQRNPADGSYAVAEAVCFVPDVIIKEDVNGGRYLARKDLRLNPGY